MIRPEAPCKNCKERYLGCHGDCEKYADFKNAQREMKIALKKSMEYDSYKVKSKERFGRNGG